MEREGKNKYVRTRVKELAARAILAVFVSQSSVGIPPNDGVSHLLESQSFLHERALELRDNSPGNITTTVQSPPSPASLRHQNPIVFDNSPGTTTDHSSPASSLKHEHIPHRSKAQAENPVSPAEAEFNNIIENASKHPEIFSKKDIEDLKMYLPIYLAVAKKFHMDWYLLWINHKKESWTSSSIRAFNGGTYPYFGGWQRNVLIWPQDYVDKAFKGLEYLKKIKTKNKSDAPEAAAAGAMLAPNIEKYAHLGKEKAVFNALRIFTGGIKSAQERTGIWKKLFDLRF